ncbi:MAG: tRNA preQ1(34) S-adenosylmethionine ribosyltransferase-isomerase QueA [Deltaproteobacteria bacterium]|nr:tRNA preQ1(34) S-adenosylmethionine ribosyltransferase-isomerase QueA [Deltaproteobacteria bacterium]
MEALSTSDFDYTLPEEQIAQGPPAERDGGRLLCLGRESEHQQIRDLPRFLPPNSLIVVNDSKVIPARLAARRASGGQVEVLLLERIGLTRWKAMVRASKQLREQEVLEVDGGGAVCLSTTLKLGRAEVELSDEALPWRVGAMPLPPYIQRPADAEDAKRYQTVYAREDGSVAAPTAGLHFTDALLGRLRAEGHEIVSVTLHVGPGTFVPVRVEDPDEHQMEQERYEVSEDTARAISVAKSKGRPVIAVGTTVVRTLEASAALAGEGRTELFIRPGYRFRIVDGLVTNFHLPRSTLLMLVSALAGREQVLAAYADAVKRGYRFYSYGDAMLMTKQEKA